MASNPEEAARSDALRRYEILNSPAEPNFDRITRLAAAVLDRPVCTLALADRDRFWFKSKHGVDATEIPRRMAFCEETIGGNAVFVVQDASLDPRFADAPVVKEAPHFRFYAGAPLVTPAGVTVGSLCVLDPKPGADLSPKDRGVLTDLALTAVELFEARARQIELARCTDEIAHLARHDPLTGLPNRRRFVEVHESAVFRSEGRGVALLYLDLDGFKAVNDGRGHARGDAVLRQAADRIRSCLPEEASVARIGGDEFAVLLPGRTADLPRDASSLSARLIQRIELPYEIIGPGIRISCSIGVALAEEGTELDELLSRADTALYQAKARGRGRCVFAEVPHPIESLALCG